jgi:hypothetical protein
MSTITALLTALDSSKFLTQIIVLWPTVIVILSLVNKYILRGRFPRIAAAIASVCALSPGDVEKFIEEIAKLVALFRSLPVIPVTVAPVVTSTTTLPAPPPAPSPASSASSTSNTPPPTSN